MRVREAVSLRTAAQFQRTIVPIFTFGYKSPNITGWVVYDSNREYVIVRLEIIGIFVSD